MTKFFDSFSGEYRDLNYHGIKCKREPGGDVIGAATFVFGRTIASGSLWSKPADRTQECAVYVIDGTTYYSVSVDEPKP